ncbi:hypothetical protein QT982_33815, partial [Microcoleus sp. herbarium2]
MSITCILFAPNSPQQNPVEDIWLKAKNFLRKYWYLCRFFKIIKFLFELFTKEHKFDFPKILSTLIHRKSFRIAIFPLLSLSARNNQERLEHKT